MMLRRARTLPATAGFALALAVLVMLLIRTPSALDDLRHRAASEIGHGDLGGALVVADSIGLDNDFVRAAPATVPRNAQFANLLPDPAQAQQTYGVNPETIDAIPGLMQEMLLPAREIEAPVKGSYVLCYLCDTTPWDSRTHWLWRGTRGDSIGLVYR